MEYMLRHLKYLSIVFLAYFQDVPLFGQLLDEFIKPSSLESGIPESWSFATGDGNSIMGLKQHQGYASIYVDATQDKNNIWWALVRRPVPGLDLDLLMKPDYELRVEARIKVSHAPRRVNLHFNHQRTTDFHSHLMEYDIPDTTQWHTISLTTKDFEVQPGDQINAQMALMDWGLEKYRVDIDYFKVDVVNAKNSGPDLGMKLPYHPPIADPKTFSQHIPVIADAIINSEFPDLNFNDWGVDGNKDQTRLLAVNGNQIIILRWDFKDLSKVEIRGSGLLELTTHSVERSPVYTKDFGMVRIVEILGGEPKWTQDKVSYQSFCMNQPLTQVLNTQMVIDYPLPRERGGKALFTISQPVLQRMIEGKTLGLAIRPLGAVHASFYAMEQEGGTYSARLHFNTK